jgi:hypothetical protein
LPLTTNVASLLLTDERHVVAADNERHIVAADNRGGG